MSSDSEEDEGVEDWGDLAADLACDDDSSDDAEPEPAPDEPAPEPAAAALGVARRRQLGNAEFEAEFRHRAPVLLAGFAQGWAALSRWSSPPHLASLLDQEVLVLRSPDGQRFLKRDCEQLRQPFHDVALQLFGPAPTSPEAGRMYARAPLASGLRSEVDLSGLETLVGGKVFKDANSGVWLGTAGNVTPLHYDLCHGFLIQVLGSKSITYFEPDDYRCLYQRAENPELSQVDLDAWRRGEDREELERKWPLFGDATPRTVRVEPGDCLYTPPCASKPPLSTAGAGAGSRSSLQA